MSEKKDVVTGSGAPHWSEKYELVVGLEVHAQLITESKAYSSDPNAYGDHPNTNVSVITDMGVEGRIEKTTHEMVQRVAEKAEPKLTLIMRELIASF